MTSDTCWTSIPRLRRSVEMRTRLEPVRKLRKISSRSFWDNPACWRNKIKTIFQSIFCQNFSLEFKCWSRCGKKKNTEKRRFFTPKVQYFKVLYVFLDPTMADTVKSRLFISFSNHSTLPRILQKMMVFSTVMVS